MKVMRNRLFLFCAILSLICINCKPKGFHSSDIPHILIDIDDLSPIAFSDLFSEAELIPLETIDSCLMGIVYPRFTDNYYFMRDNRQQMAVAFDENGKFKFKISNQGDAPDQYRHLNEIAYNPFTQKLLLAENQDYIHEYDLAGKFVKKERQDSILNTMEDIIPINSDTLILVGGHQVVEYYFYSCKQHRILNHIKDSTFHLGRNKFYQYGKDYFHFKWFDNIVYKISGVSMKPAYCFDFGKYNHEHKDYTALFKILKETRNDDEKAWSVLSRNFSFIINNVQENNRYIFLVIRKLDEDPYQSSVMNIVYDKSANQAYLLNVEDKGVVWNNWMSRLTDSYYVTFMSADEKGVLDVNMLNQKSRDICDKIKEDDNPVIIKYYLKQ